MYRRDKWTYKFYKCPFEILDKQWSCLKVFLILGTWFYINFGWNLVWEKYFHLSESFVHRNLNYWYVKKIFSSKHVRLDDARGMTRKISFLTKEFFLNSIFVTVSPKAHFFFTTFLLKLYSSSYSGNLMMC